MGVLESGEEAGGEEAGRDVVAAPPTADSSSFPSATSVPCCFNVGLVDLAVDRNERDDLDTGEEQDLTVGSAAAGVGLTTAWFFLFVA